MPGRRTVTDGKGTPRGGGRTILAYTAEDGRLDAVRQAGVDLARREDGRLILYDVDAAGIFQKPLPTNWSGQGSEDEFGDILGPADLERAGRHAIAVQVSDARDGGVDAWAWLPGELNARALSDYVTRAGVDVIVTSPEMGQPGGPLEDLERAWPDDIEQAGGSARVEVVIVEAEAEPKTG